ncbi:MAG: dynamin family protein [Candidatus Sumerlaeaceae bacterium]|nr:dynamin family protein [Candidatus Sumerlaeaceae bacterium]
MDSEDHPITALLAEAKDACHREEARERLQALAARWERNVLHVAVLGQFKRGKSTLINALLGHAILPAAAVPVTSVPTFISHGTGPRAQVTFSDGSSQPAPPAELPRYVTESGNPHNILQVERVDVICPAPLLQPGVVILDTPGIGSTHRHNTMVTLGLLPVCDAAIFVLSADPPVTEAELEFLRAVAAEAQHLFVVLNKADYLDRDARTEVAEFDMNLIRTVLPNFAGPLYCVSATGALARKTTGDAIADGLDFDRFESDLAGFLQRRKRDLLQRAVAHKAAQVLREEAAMLRLHRKALEMDAQERARRLAEFEARATSLTRERDVLKDLLVGDGHRLTDLVRQAAHRCSEEVLSQLRAEAVEWLRRSSNGHSSDKAERLLREMLHARANELFCQHKNALERQVQDHMSVVVSDHSRRLESTVIRLRQAANELFDAGFADESVDPEQITVRGISWVVPPPDERLGGIRLGFLDRLLPHFLIHRALMRRAMALVRDTVMTNTERLRWAFLQRLQEVLRAYAAQLEEQFDSTMANVRACLAEATVTSRGTEQERTARIATLYAEEERLSRLTRRIERAGPAPEGQPQPASGANSANERQTIKSQGGYHEQVCGRCFSNGNT